MFCIHYKSFDETGHFKGEKKGTKRYTLREAMANLEANGFKPWGSKKRKLHKVYVKPGYHAFIAHV